MLPISALFALLSSAPSQAPDRSSPEPAVRDALHGEVAPQPFAFANDDVPRPAPPSFEPGDDGDRLAAPASGDPFYLGFLGGKHYPPADERLDPRLLDAAVRAEFDARGHAQSYGFVMFSKRMTRERVAVLESLGVRVLDFHPFYTLKAALTAEQAAQVAQLDFVRWVGAAQPWQRVDPRLAAELDRLAPGESLELHVSLFESDLCEASTSQPVGTVEHADRDGAPRSGDASQLPRVWTPNGWQQRSLEELGVEVLGYFETIDVFHVRASAAQLEALLEFDFVQFVEPVFPVETCHDESMPLVNADRMRMSYDGATNSAALVGVIDSGCDIGHTALDPAIVGWDLTTENLGSFQDFGGHGSHVSGTIFGNGDVDDSYQGAAPGLGWGPTGRVFNIKAFDSNNQSPGTNWPGVYAAARSSYSDGVNVTPRPMVVNNSYGEISFSASGVETWARQIDNEVWVNNQVYVFAAGNEGAASGSIRTAAAAKNALTVGAVNDYFTGGADPGAIRSSSSRGPCADGRWKPNVAAPGSRIYSVLGETFNEYADRSGTSMAAPHVTGLVAQLCDHYAFLRYNPEVVSAVLMASAITDGDVLLSSPASNPDHFNDFGAGRVDAYKANYSTGQQGLYFWSTTLDHDESTFVEFTVDPGATRLTAVMHYIEQEASAGASQALRNDFGMRLDALPFSAGNDTGEYFAHQSTVDNTEIRSLANPTATTWRMKIAPISTAPGETVRVGLSVVVTYADTTPNPTFTLSADDLFVKTNELVTLSAQYFNPQYIAAAVYLDATLGGATLSDTYGDLVDGSSASWIANQQSGQDVCIGNVRHGATRTVNWALAWATEGVKSVDVEARSDNAVDKSASVDITVDGTQPGAVSALDSTSHTAGVWSNQTQVDYVWNAATDNLSGIDGYGLFTTVAATSPGAGKDIEELTSHSEVLSQGSWWFNIRSVDNCGNWDTDFESFGPILIDTTAPGAPGAVSSTTHAVGVASCSTTVSVDWGAATDAGGAGVAGYLVVWDAAPATVPVGALNVVGTSYTQDIGSSLFSRYLHVRAVDAAGNMGPTVHFGPIQANANAVANYCVGKANSLGCVPTIGTNGVQPSKSAGDFTVTCTNALNQKNGLLFFGFASLAAPFQGGTLCVASPTIRTAAQNSAGSANGSDCSGSYAFAFTTSAMDQLGLDPGETVYAQWWMRDPQSPSTTGLSNAVRFTVCE